MDTKIIINMKNIFLAIFLLVSTFAFSQSVRTTITSDGTNVTVSTPVNTKVIPVCDFHWVFTDGYLKLWIEGNNEIIPGGRLGSFTISGATTQQAKLDALGAITDGCNAGGSGGGADGNGIYSGSDSLGQTTTYAKMAATSAQTFGIGKFANTAAPNFSTGDYGLYIKPTTTTNGRGLGLGHRNAYVDIWKGNNYNEVYMQARKQTGSNIYAEHYLTPQSFQAYFYDSLSTTRRFSGGHFMGRNSNYIENLFFTSESIGSFPNTSNAYFGAKTGLIADQSSIYQNVKWGDYSGQGISQSDSRMLAIGIGSTTNADDAGVAIDSAIVLSERLANNTVTTHLKIQSDGTNTGNTVSFYDEKIQFKNADPVPSPGDTTLYGMINVAGTKSPINLPLSAIGGGGSADGNGIYSGDGTAPADVDVAVTDNIDFDAGTLFIDGTNNRVGIGTASPNTYMHVKGHPTVNGEIARFTGYQSNGTSDVEIIISTTETDFKGISIDVNADERLEINGGQLLSLESGSFGTGIDIKAGSSSALKIGANNATTIQIHDTSNGLSYGTTYYNIDPGTNNFIIEGNVGIGTTSADRHLHAEASDAVTNAVTYAQRLTHITSGTATTGFGVGTEYELENASGTNRVAATGEVTWSDAVNATEDATYKLRLIRAGTLTDAVTVTSLGAVESLYQRFGAGSPEGVVTAPVGAFYSRTDGGAGTSLYVKESGTGNTGWVAK